MVARWRAGESRPTWFPKTRLTVGFNKKHEDMLHVSVVCEKLMQCVHYILPGDIVVPSIFRLPSPGWNGSDRIPGIPLNVDPVVVSMSAFLPGYRMEPVKLGSSPNVKIGSGFHFLKCS